MIKQCPKCRSLAITMADTRPSNGSIRRRRRCGVCQHRWTTYEVTETDFKFLQNRENALAEPKFIAAFRAFVQALSKTEKDKLLEELFS